MSNTIAPSSSTPLATLLSARMLTTGIATALFLLFLFSRYDFKKAALALTAVAIGFVFFRCQFGFSYTWRVFVTHGDGRGLRAQMLWIALAALPFALLTGTDGILPVQAAANVRPLTIGVAVGALLFGVGMQMGGACTSGSLVGAGQGNGIPIISIIGLIIGILIAASQITFWSDLPAIAPFSFYREWGLAGVVVLIVTTAAAAAATRLYRRRDEPPLPVGRLPLVHGAILLACLSVLLLLFGDQPWGIIYGFSLLGGRLLIYAGFEDVEFWDFWAVMPNGEELLYGGWFASTQLTTTVGMLFGVSIAAVFSGKFNAQWQLPSIKRLLLAISGGLLMGYGALISFGCNIGSYISALSSGSLHGWLWLLFALIGTIIGVGVRRLVRLDQ